MKDSVILEGKIYISAKRAAKIINYAQDYIGQLCRSGKLDCKMIGRSWFVTEESLLAHRENAIDNTEERVLKAIKNNDIAVKETIKAVIEEKKIEVPVTTTALITSPITPEAPVVSPIQQTNFKYEVEKKSFLPELNKKVPAAFELPKNVLKLTPAPFVAPRVEPKHSSTLAIPTVNPYTATIVVVLIALGGFFFTLSHISLNNKSLSYGNDASVGSAASELLSEILKTIGLKRKSPPPLAALERPAVKNDAAAGETGTAGGLNGIGIFPAQDPTADELAKQKIMNSFSDEVIIERDKDGNSGVITPVFKKTNGNEFVYVLVPVNEKKQ